MVVQRNTNSLDKFAREIAKCVDKASDVNFNEMGNLSLLKKVILRISFILKKMIDICVVI